MKLLQEAVAREYGVTLTNLELQGETVSSELYFATSAEGDRFVLKGSLWYPGFTPDPPAALEAVYSTAADLRVAGVPLQFAHATKTGTFTFMQGGVPFALLAYLDGFGFSGAIEEWDAAGHALGQFHKAGKTLCEDAGVRTRVESIPFEMPYAESLVAYREGFRKYLASDHVCNQQEVCTAIRNTLPALDDAIAYIEETFADVTTTKTVVHNDFNSNNGLYKENSFVGFIDIDQLGYGEAIGDVGNTLTSFVSHMHTNGSVDAVPAGVKTFLSAYHAEFPLSDAEYACIAAAGMRWDVLRILRSTRRHHFEADRFPELLEKLPRRIQRIGAVRDWFSFLPY